MKIVVDSYAWIEIFLGSKEGADARRNLEGAEQVFTPDIVLAEVARKYTREGASDSVIRKRLGAIVEGSEVTNIDEVIAAGAGRAFLELVQRARREALKKPSLFDAIVLATARALGAAVLTGNRHFRTLPETIWIGA